MSTPAEIDAPDREPDPQRTHRDPPSGTSGPPGSSGRAGLPQSLASEWTKLWTARALRGTLAATVATLPVLAGVVAATGSIQPDDTVLGGSLTGAVPALLAAGTFGALVMSSEHTQGTIRTTLTAVPRRATVLAAKALLTATALLVLTLPAATAAYAIGRITLDTDVHPSGDPWPALLGVALTLTVGGLLGLAAGTALRSSAGAVTAVIGLVLLPSLLGPLFGDLQRWVGGAAPAGPLEKFTQTSDVSPEAVGSLGAWPHLAVVTGCVAVALVAGAWRLRWRDI